MNNFQLGLKTKQIMFIMEIGVSNWQKACFVHQIIYLVFLFLARPTTTHENLSTIKETVPIYQ